MPDDVGLRGMQERLCQLGGNLQVDSNESATAVTVVLPIRCSSAGRFPGSLNPHAFRSFRAKQQPAPRLGVDRWELRLPTLGLLIRSRV